MLRQGRAKTAAWLVALNYVQAGLGFLISLWLANKLGGDGYGMLCYGMVIGAFCAVVVGFASDKTLVRDLIHAKDAAEMFTASFVLRAAIAVLVVIGGTIWLLSDSSAGVKPWAVLLGLFWGTSMGMFPTAWYDSRYEMHVHAAVTLGEKALYGASAVLLLACSFDLSAVVLVMLCLVGSRLVSLGVQWSYALRSFRPTTRNIKSDSIWLLQQNVLILGAALAAMLLTHANQLVLESRRGAASLAYYAIAFQIVAIVQIMQGQIVRLLAPRIAEITKPGNPPAIIRSRLIRFSGYSLLITLVLVLPLAAFAPWLIRICLNPEYLAAVAPLRILCLWIVIYGAGRVVNQFLLCLRLNRSYFVLTLVAGCTALILGQFLIPRYGANGVALALLIAHFGSIATQCLLVWKRTGYIGELESPRVENCPDALKGPIW